jgi:hypothetical protein
MGMNAAEILSLMTADDISDLLALTERTGGNIGNLMRASELDDNGDRLLSLGVAEVRRPAVYGIDGSKRLGTSDIGLDVVFELERREQAA